MKRYLALVLALLLLGASVAAAQEDEPDDKNFPELKAFHDVMAKMWHTDFPKNDWATIRAAAPKLKQVTDTLVAAKLPEGYQPREAQFQVDVKLLAVSVDTVVAAAKGTDDGALKQAVIKMHETFHDLIYNLNRKDLPESDQCNVPE